MLPLETESQRRKASVWTRAHGLFAMAQLGVFGVSLVLLVLFFRGVVPFSWVHVSVLVKIAMMLGAGITGAYWEFDVFGKWWFAPEYFYEDAMTVNVVLLHVAYLVVAYAWPFNVALSVAMLCVAYGAYAFNVVQYLLRHHARVITEAMPQEQQAA